MSKVPADLRYTEQHEWAKLDGDIVTMGVTDFAQEQLTDIVFVDLPDPGLRVKVGDAVVVLESVKSVSDVYTPVSGEILEINEELVDHPEIINESPFEEGWIVKIKVAGSGELSKMMDAAAYEKHLESEDH